jgi:hypothetical protein
MIYLLIMALSICVLILNNRRDDRPRRRRLRRRSGSYVGFPLTATQQLPPPTPPLDQVARQ